ncbi:unnamed protein product [Arctia plantaginis]|uniref:Carboxylesterase type B domain-containing protein n=1 Tax=Arctia plantaginis TaxID=874455 RepID=A0A8S1A9X4_ARCPL|nr:unnamed protein product [Arctia plantaginis]
MFLEKCALLVLLFHTAFGQSRVGPLVKTSVGVIKGLKAEDGEYLMFLGIPFAQVDADNPFGAAKPYPAFENTFEAYSDSKICSQVREFRDTLAGSIDCLNLNIFVPLSASPSKRLPVFFWIYGGGFINGSDQTTTMIANFVKFGNPTPEVTELLPITWIPVTNKLETPCLNIDTELKLELQSQLRIDPLVQTSVGLIKGLRADDGDYSMFLGIPFGQVDVNNPFGVAKPYPAFENTFEAFNDSTVCPQVEEFKDTLAGSLDCLNLNIFVPDSATSLNRLPVFFWIYGGGFINGSDQSTTMLANFVKFGNPTPEVSALLPIQWTPITSKSMTPAMNIDSPLKLENRPFNERVTFWDLFYTANAYLQIAYPSAKVSLTDSS